LNRKHGARVTNDERLLTDFIDSFARLDDLIVVSGRNVPLDLDVGWEDGFQRWRPTRMPTRVQANVQSLMQFPKKLPPLYERLILSYCWLEVDLGLFALLPNMPSEGLEGSIGPQCGDPILNAVLIPRGFVQFAKAPGDNYDPVCFDLNRPTKHGDYPVVRFEHETILCEEKLGDRDTICPSFRSAMIEIVANAKETKRRKLE